MDYRIQGLSPEPFIELYGRSEEELARSNAKRYIADTKPGFPDRIEMRDVDPGAFNQSHWMLDADVCAGADLEALARRFLSNPAVDYLQAHFAKQGCYAARIDRA